MSEPVTNLAGLPPHSIDAERATLGAMLLATPAIARTIIGDLELRPDHFYLDRHRQVFEAMVDLVDRDAQVDLVTVTRRLRERGTLDAAGGENEVQVLAREVPGVAGIRAYAESVKSDAFFRTNLTAAYELMTACYDRDRDALLEAEAGIDLSDAGRSKRRLIRGPDLGRDFISTFGTPDYGKRFEWPLRKLNTLSRGGARRGHYTFLTGPTSHGKSSFLDQALDEVSHGMKVMLYLNEMAPEERMERFIARNSGVSIDLISEANRGVCKLTDDQNRKVIEAASEHSIDFVACEGWTAKEICRHARRHKPDVFAFDIVQRLPYRATSRLRDMEEASNEFDRLAKEIQAHVIVVGHINRARAMQSGVVPIPVLSDVRDNAGFGNDPDNVLAVWQEQDLDTGKFEGTGLIKFLKCRGGELGGLEVTFDPKRYRFLPTERDLAVAA